MRIIFVRHGQDDETRRGGWSRYGLQPEGHAQARCTAEYLRQRTDLHIAAIYASDLVRTMETAAYFADALQLPIQPDAALREVNNGVLAGMPLEQAQAQYPGLYFRKLEMDEPFPCGESPRAFFQRIKAWFSQFLAENRDFPGDILIVTHGGVIKALYALVKNQRWSNQNSTVAADKCSIHILDVDTMTMEVENQTVWHPAESNDTQEEFDHVCR